MDTGQECYIHHLRGEITMVRIDYGDYSLRFEEGYWPKDGVIVVEGY
jgi:hypothetical protein